MQISECKKVLLDGGVSSFCNCIDYPVVGVAAILLISAFARCSPRCQCVEQVLCQLLEDRQADAEYRRLYALYQELRAEAFFLGPDHGAAAQFKKLLPKNPQPGPPLPAPTQHPLVAGRERATRFRKLDNIDMDMSMCLDVSLTMRAAADAMIQSIGGFQGNTVEELLVLSRRAAEAGPAFPPFLTPSVDAHSPDPGWEQRALIRRVLAEIPAPQPQPDL